MPENSVPLAGCALPPGIETSGEESTVQVTVDSTSGMKDTKCLIPRTTASCLLLDSRFMTKKGEKIVLVVHLGRYSRSQKLVEVREVSYR